MNAEFKTKWIAALRSGKYKQGKHALRSDEGFCCLGVACDIYDPTLWKEPKAPKSYYTYKAATSVPPMDVQQVILEDRPVYSVEGFRDRNGFITSLSALNDSGEFGFDQIADVIQYFF